MTEIPEKPVPEKSEIESLREEMVALQAKINLIVKKYQRVVRWCEDVLSLVKTNEKVTSWMFNETVGRVGKHIPDEIRKLVKRD